MTNIVISFTYHRLRKGVLVRVALAICLTLAWGLAIPSAHAQQAGIRSHRGWLGVLMQESPDGRVLVDEVIRGSPAERAKIQRGDLIEQVEGVAVHSPKQMAQQVGRFGAGAVVRVQFLRKGTPLTVMPRLEPYPSNEQLLRLQWLGRPAPALQGLLATDGSPGPILDSFRGKVLVLDFWASFCIACRVSTVSMNGWHQRYAGQGLEIVGIAAEPPEVVEQASRRFAMRYQAYADPDMTTTASYRVQELPSVVIIDRKGIIRDVATGYAPERMHQLETLIQRLLREPNP
ncbi:MAG: Thiol-disulfide oxidoreductase ResA [Deltaproteobacteria bacterium ADurb.Bin207]|jgi:thiol-disulfide isomerase/thioredoxin|nr:MAG: Thiol-disulfide oxidoreductase ResA [Deltaproteobacteria bacterium ADurb.Bin207]HPY17305.1 redoxin domain-containing protein [Polyangiaceae bacterium]HQB45890.1 redoxin domain-containing protein [Polyangiaceae bacterium]